MYRSCIERKTIIGFDTTRLFKSRSHRACDRGATSPRLKKMTIAERLQKSRWSFIMVAMRSLIGRRTKLVAASLLNMHKRLDATDSDRRLVAMVFWKSPISRRTVADQSSIGRPTYRRSVGDYSVIDRRLFGCICCCVIMLTTCTEMISSMSTYFIKILFWSQNGRQPVGVQLKQVSEESATGRRSLKTSCKPVADPTATGRRSIADCMQKLSPIVRRLVGDWSAIIFVENK